MGFIDRVKEAAQDVAVEAKKVSAQAQGKLEETQLKRRMDDHAKQLGYLVYRERTQGVVEGAETERLVSEITSLELQIAQAAAHARAKQAEAAPGAAPAQAPEPSAAPETPAGTTGGPTPEAGSEPPSPPPAPPASGAPPTP
jgi:septal ring factor EnvC (AmiA/AmiB activator)